MMSARDQLIDAIEEAMTGSWDAGEEQYDPGTSERIADAVTKLLDHAYKDGYDTGKMHATRPGKVTLVEIAEAIDEAFDGYEPYYSEAGYCVDSNAARKVLALITTNPETTTNNN